MVNKSEVGGKKDSDRLLAAAAAATALEFFFLSKDCRKHYPNQAILNPNPTIMNSDTEYDRPPAYASELLERKTDPVHRMRTPFSPSRSLRGAQTPGRSRRLRSTELKRSLSAVSDKPAATTKPYTRAAAAAALGRRAKSALDLEDDDDEEEEDDNFVDSNGQQQTTEEQPWTRDTWLKLDRYFQEQHGNFEETCKRFYRFESLYREEGSPRVSQRWSKRNIMRRITLLDQVTRKHHGRSLAERVRAYERKVRMKRMSKAAKQERDRHTIEQPAVPESSSAEISSTKKQPGAKGLRGWISYLLSK